MFDLSKPKGSKDVQFKTTSFAPPPILSHGPRIDLLDELRVSRQQPIKPIQQPMSIEPTVKPSSWEMIKAGDVKGLAKEVGIGAISGLSKTGAVKQNIEAASMFAKSEFPFLSDYGKRQQGRIQQQEDFLKANPVDSVPGIIGQEIPNIPLWMAGEGAVSAIGKGISKLTPSIVPTAQRISSKVPSFIKGGAKDAAAYGSVVAPVESIREGESFGELLDREKQTPGIFLGGAAFRGIGAGAKLGKDVAGEGGSLRQALELRRINPEREIGINPLTDVQNAYRSPSLRDAQANSLSNTFADTPNLMSPARIKPLQQGIDDAVGVKEPLSREMVRQRKADVKSALTLRPGEETLSLQRRLPRKTKPLTWTNREGIQSAGPQPIRSITEQNLNQLPRINAPLRPPTGRVPNLGQTTDIEIPIINGRLGNPVETPRIRSMGANIEGPSASLSSGSLRSQEPIRPIGEGPGNAETFRSKIDRDPVKGKSFTEMFKGIRTQFTDDLAPLENLEKSVTGKLASAEDSLYKQGRLFRGSPERAGEMIRSSLEPVIKQVEKSGKTTKDLGDYALAVHAKDVNAKGINSGFTNEEIAATIQKYGTPEMEAARKELMKISNESLDSLAEAGIINESLVTALREKHPNYMPLFRSFEDDKVEFASGVSKALANVTAPIERLKGSDRNVIDPIESMVKNVYRTVSAVDRNKVASQLGGLADKDTNAAFIRRLPEGEERSRLNSVYAMENGKKVYYEVQPDVYKAIMNLDKESSNILIRMLQKPASLLRAGATLTPEFSLRNPIRDVPAAFAVSKSGLNPVTDIPRALFDVIQSKRGKETLYNQFLKDNAGYGNIISMDRKVHQDVMNDILSQPASKKFVNVLSGKSLIRVLRSIADVSESATKLGEYRAALRSGASRQEAAYRARDLMDFARAGASVRETNKIVSFLNANIQGKSKLYRAIKEDPAGVTARAFTSVTLPTIGVYMAQKYLANDEQKKIIDGAEEWLTSTFWLIPVPGTNQVARIPKPFDLAPAFANLPERTLKYIFDNEPEAFDGFAKQTLASTSIPTMITGLVPFIEGMANYSFFKQGPIIPQRESGLNFPDQYDIKTTETAKFLAKGVNKATGGQGPLKNFGSPRIMDNTIKGATAGLGTYATSAIDFVAETAGLVDKKQKPAKNISEKPLIRAFLVSEKSDKSLGQVYDEKDKLTRDKGSLKLESPKAKFPEEKRLKKLNEVTGEIGDITKDIRKIENDKNLTPLVKRERINSLTEKRNALSRKVMGK